MTSRKLFILSFASVLALGACSADDSANGTGAVSTGGSGTSDPTGGSGGSNSPTGTGSGGSASTGTSGTADTTGTGTGGGGSSSTTGSGGSAGAGTGGGSSGTGGDGTGGGSSTPDAGKVDATAPAGDGGAALSYAKDVDPIIKNRCKTCHTTDKKGGFNWDYTTVFSAVTDTATKACTYLTPGAPKHIVPGKPNESLIYLKITKTKADLTAAKCGDPMPEAPMGGQAAVVTQTEKDTIRMWIEQGAKP